MALVRRGTSDPGPPPRGELVETVIALSATDPDRRQRAALDLNGEAQAVPALLARVWAETDSAAREAVLTALTSQDSVEVAGQLAAHLASDDAGLRGAVVEALSAMPVGVTPLLPELVGCEDHDVRIMATLIISNLRDTGAVSWLVRMVADDPHPNVVAAAVEALLPMLGEEHVALLEGVRERFPTDPFLRFTVDTALTRLAEVTR